MNAFECTKIEYFQNLGNLPYLYRGETFGTYRATSVYGAVIGSSFDPSVILRPWVRIPDNPIIFWNRIEHNIYALL